uniref:Uncharacterized protein n=1 Tax=Anguilla anguilla TaxID=7936 RepID=A0A0E9SGG9_ANGAN
MALCKVARTFTRIHYPIHTCASTMDFTEARILEDGGQQRG